MSPVATHAREIGVTVPERTGVARVRWPLTFSVPFATGEARDPRLHLTGPGGVLPVESRALARWPDGSLRWLQVDTQISLSADATVRLHLRVDENAAPPGGRQGAEEADVRTARGKDRSPAPVASPLRIDSRDGSWPVDTGAIRFRVAGRDGILSTIEDESGPLLGPLGSWLRSDGAMHAATVREVELLEHNPLRARWRIQGEYGGGFDWMLRVEAYAGQPFLRLWHTFVRRGDTPQAPLRRLSLTASLPAADAPATTRIGRTKGAPLVVSGPVRALQPDAAHYRVVAAGAGAGTEQSGRLAGWWVRATSDQALAVSHRWWWQQYPKGVSLEAHALTLDLWPPELPATPVGDGAARTHELAIWLGRDAEEGARAARALAEPLIGVVDPSHVASTGALPMALAPADDPHAVDRVQAAFARYQRRNARERWDDRDDPLCREGEERPRIGAFGMWSWGDWNYPGYHDDTKGCDAWGNLEYDTTLVLALGFLATGDPAMFDAMVVAARHFMDVDVIHHSSRHPSWVGMNHPKNPRHFTFELGGVDLGHTWTQGLLAYFYLTGDERGRDVAGGIADYLVRRIERGVVRGNPRQWGWPQIALEAVYDATGDERYRRAALAYARRGMRAHPPERLRHWKMGILADALAGLHAATGDAQILAWLEKYARAVVREKKRDARFYPAVAYVASLRGDAGLRAASESVVRRLNLGSWGKPFTVGGRLTFRILSLLKESDKTAPAPELPTP